MLIFGTILKQIEDTKELLSKCFETSDMGEGNIILGIKIIREQEIITLS